VTQQIQKAKPVGWCARGVRDRLRRSHVHRLRL